MWRIRSRNARGPIFMLALLFPDVITILVLSGFSLFDRESQL
jgi:hypothetical protein